MLTVFGNEHTTKSASRNSFSRSSNPNTSSATPDGSPAAAWRRSAIILQPKAALAIRAVAWPIEPYPTKPTVFPAIVSITKLSQTTLALLATRRGICLLKCSIAATEYSARELLKAPRPFVIVSGVPARSPALTEAASPPFSKHAWMNGANPSTPAANEWTHRQCGI